MNLAVARIGHGEKSPRYDDWNLRSAEPGEFADDDNIGIQTGGINGDLVCVDLDSPQAVALADQFLPPTDLCEGWSGKPRSHRYYRVTNVPPELTADPQRKGGGKFGGPRGLQYNAVLEGKGKGSCVIDVLGTGKQAVAPPSLHKSGEHRQWHAFGEPAVVDCRVLYEAVDRLAVACGCASILATRLARHATSRPAGPRTSAPPAAVERRYHVGLPPLDERVKRARAYLEKVPEAVSGEGGHHHTFKVACLLLRDFALDETSAGDLFEEYNERCDPPWSSAELEHKLADADRFDGLRGAKLLPELKEEPDDPHRLARAFLEQIGMVDGRHPLVNYGDEWLLWTSNHYEVIPEGEFKGRLNAAIRTELECSYRAACQHAETQRREVVATYAANLGMTTAPLKAAKLRLLKVTTNLVANTAQALLGMTLLPATVDQPSWLGRDGAAEHRPYLALHNGLIDVDAYLAGTARLMAHSPRWFSRVCLPYAWNPTASAGQWLQALDLTFAGDAQRISLLQEWFGHCLVPRAKHSEFVVLVGEGGNGKSVICAALMALLGRQNVSTVGLEAFNDRFGLNATVGKLANIAADMGEIDKVAEGKLKSFTGGDEITIDRKNRQQLTFKPTARLTFATNNVPRFSDKTDGVWRRALIVPCDVTIPATQRVLGMNEVGWWEHSGELPGMLAWALNGLRRLQERGKFTECQAAAGAIEKVRRDCNPAREFLLSYCEVAANEFVATRDLYVEYRHWCEQNGYTHPLASNKFGEEVRRAFPAIAATQRALAGRRPRVYAGIRLTAES